MSSDVCDFCGEPLTKCFVCTPEDYPMLDFSGILSPKPVLSFCSKECIGKSFVGSLDELFPLEGFKILAEACLESTYLRAEVARIHEKSVERAVSFIPEAVDRVPDHLADIELIEYGSGTFYDSVLTVSDVVLTCEGIDTVRRIITLPRWNTELNQMSVDSLTYSPFHCSSIFEAIKKRHEDNLKVERVL